MHFYISRVSVWRNKTNHHHHRQKANQKTPDRQNSQLFPPTYSCNQNSPPAANISCTGLLKYFFIKCSQNITSILIILACWPNWLSSYASYPHLQLKTEFLGFFSLPNNLSFNTGKQLLKPTGFSHFSPFLYRLENTIFQLLTRKSTMPAIFYFL